MKSYALLEVFTVEELELHRVARNIVAVLPDKVNGDLIRCHELARVVGGILGLEVQDGHYGFVEHSWCWTTKPKCLPGEKFPPMWSLPNILDPYVPGAVPQVQLFHATTALPINYRFGNPRDDIMLDAVEELTAIARKHI